MKCISSLQSATSTASKNVKIKATRNKFEKQKTNTSNVVAEYGVLINRVPDSSGNTTPNKPFVTPRRMSGMFGNPGRMLRKANLFSVQKERKPSDFDDEATKNTANASSKEISFEMVINNIPKEKELKKDKPKEEGIFSKLSSWFSKELTHHCCKCSEQDKVLNS